MSLETVDEALIVRYLLDEVSADERRLLEQRYFLDDQLFESVCALEEQLIRDFLLGELTKDQARRFEARYLQSPQLSERVESARLLMQSAAAVLRELPLAAAARAAPAREERMPVEPGAPQGRFNSGRSFLERLRESFRLRAAVLGFAAAGPVVAAMLLAAWFGLDNLRLRTELARSESRRISLAAHLQAEAAAPQSNPAQERNVLPERADSESHIPSAVRESAKLYAEGVKAAPLAFVLSPGVTRGDGGGQRRLVIPAEGVDRVRMDLDFTPFDHYASYLVIVSSVDNGEVSSHEFSGKRPLGPGSELAIDLPAPSLPEGDYVIVVKGRLGTARYEDLESYSFRVVRGSKPR
jgi:anti-sigma factor RsiW